MATEIRVPFQYDVDAASEEAATGPFGESLTVQAPAEETDINCIVRRFGVTGELPQNVRVPTFQDFDEVFDFQSAQNAIIMARQSFMAMPPEIRNRFNNDPQEFLEFCDDEANLPEMRKLGLAVPEEEPEAPPPVTLSKDSPQ